MSLIRPFKNKVWTFTNLSPHLGGDHYKHSKEFSYVYVSHRHFIFPNPSLAQKAKLYYNFGEEEEFQCYTGFDLDGFQFINCLPDGTWSEPQGKCLSKSVLSNMAIYQTF